MDKLIDYRKLTMIKPLIEAMEFPMAKKSELPFYVLFMSSPLILMEKDVIIARVRIRIHGEREKLECVFPESRLERRVYSQLEVAADTMPQYLQSVVKIYAPIVREIRDKLEGNKTEARGKYPEFFFKAYSEQMKKADFLCVIDFAGVHDPMCTDALRALSLFKDGSYHYGKLSDAKFKLLRPCCNALFKLFMED